MQGVELPVRKLVGFRRTKELAPGETRRITIRIPLSEELRLWSHAGKRQIVHRGVWRSAARRASGDPVKTLRVRIAGSIPRTVKTVTLLPEQLTIGVGQTIDLRGRDRWSQQLAREARPDDGGSGILTVVLADDSFAELARNKLASGPVTAVGPDGATIRRRSTAWPHRHR